MSLGVRCLLTDDEAEAEAAAKELDRLNRERRGIEAKMEAEALQALEENIASLGVALFFIPMLSSRQRPQATRDGMPRRERAFQRFERRRADLDPAVVWRALPLLLLLRVLQ